MMDFSDDTFRRWCSDIALCCQPLNEYPATYRGMEFEAAGGYWWFNGHRYALLKDLWLAMIAYNDWINHLLMQVADS